MSAVDISQVLSDLITLSQQADTNRNDSLHGACFAAAMMLVDAASEDGVRIDSDALGFMSGCIEG